MVYCKWTWKDFFLPNCDFVLPVPLLCVKVRVRRVDDDSFVSSFLAYILSHSLCKKTSLLLHGKKTMLMLEIFAAKVRQTQAFWHVMVCTRNVSQKRFIDDICYLFSKISLINISKILYFHSYFHSLKTRPLRAFQATM